MKPSFFKTFIFLIVFTPTTIFCQTKSVFNTSFDVKNTDKLELNIDNIPLQIKESSDDKIHIDFKITFHNYSNKEQDSVIQQIHLEKINKGSLLKMKIFSDQEMYRRQHTANKKMTEEFLKIFKNFITNSFLSSKPMTKKEFLQEYQLEEERNREYFGEHKKDVLEKRGGKYQENLFTVFIPKRLVNSIKMEAKHCKFNFDQEVLKNVDIFADGGYMKIRKIEGSKIIRFNGSSFIRETENSELTIRSCVRNRIGGVKKTTVKIDESTLEIGEIGEDVKITDFNSKIYLYNFNEKFEKFNLEGEYSTIFFYEPKQDYSMTCYGNNTKFYFKNNDTDVVSKSSIAGRKSKIMERKPKRDKPFSGDINFDITNTKFHYLEDVKPSKN